MITIETGRGILPIEVRRSSPRKSVVRVGMGMPILAADKIPVTVPEGSGARVVDAPCPAIDANAAWIAAADVDLRMTCISMGNPHVVFYCRNVAAVPLEDVGPTLELAPIFPRRINVHFVQVLAADRVRMRTWERGSGITMACGTGASAVCVAGVLTGRTDQRIVAEVPGGELILEWDGQGEVFMTGPAEEVFTGAWLLEDAV